MAARRIYQLAKEFERDEKEIIEFLTAQGIKVANRLSAVSEDTYNLLKVKYTAPPEPPPPPPEPVKPDPPPEQTVAPVEQQPAPDKKKKKKIKPPQPDAPAAKPDEQPKNATPPPGKPAAFDKTTMKIFADATEAGNAFIENYNVIGKKQRNAIKPKLTRFTDTWALLNNITFDYPDTSPARYWYAVNKLSTRAFQLMNSYGMSHRDNLAEMREMMSCVGAKYEPREIFTDEENLKFEAQQQLLFRAFGHGMGSINDRLYELKIYAEHMRERYEQMSFVEYIINPDNDLHCKNRPTFSEMADTIAVSISGVARRHDFFCENKERIANALKNFFEWIDGYAKLKEQGADAAKLEKYLELEQKFIDLVEFMSFDNLVYLKKNKPAPYDNALNLLNEYRDNMDDPDAERNFKYKVRGIINVIYKPKEYIFLYRFGELEMGKNYRPLDIANVDAANSDAENSDAANSDVANADAANSDATNSDAENSDATNSDVANADATNSDAANSDAANSDAANSDAVNSDVANSNAVNSDAVNAEAAAQKNPADIADEV